jgi:hemerythrin
MIEVNYTHTHTHTHTHMKIVKPTKHCLKGGRRKEGERNTIEGVNLFKVPHLWNYLNKIPLCY